MRRYFYDDELQVGASLKIEGELFHHIFDVCRIQEGQHFELLNSRGKAYLVKAEKVEKKRAEISVREERLIPSLPKPHIYLYLSFPKVPTFELIVEKSVELGVHSIIPVLSDFSFVRTKAQFPSPKLPRWQKIILQATQQSGRGDLLKIEEPVLLRELLPALKPSPSAINVVAYEGKAPQSLKKYLQGISPSGIERINLFVGSEGGFSEGEIAAFQSLDFPPVTLGDQVLRVETACLTLVAALKYEFNLLESHPS